ncbi:MAG: hypothetical protein JXR26_01690 [Balneolaceae bacterium]|nr:hypothetical protein [Balneolaceae bacterium]
MTQKNTGRTYILEPSWKQFFWGYMLSILAIPLFGIGLVALYFVRKNHQQIVYEISDTQIKRVDEKYEHHVDLTDITRVELVKNWMQQKLSIGTLVLYTSASKMMLEGVEEPEKLKELLEQAIQWEIKRQQEQQKTNTLEPDYQPGSMEKMNYLTGLWQQGLISDDDYEKERKHFE